MNDKMKGIYLIIFIVILILLAGAMAIAQYIPIIRTPIIFVLSIIMLLFVIGFVIFIIRRQRK